MDPTMLVVDDIVRLRAAEKSQMPVLAYPKSQTGLLDFERLSAKDLDRFVQAAVMYLTAQSIKPAERDSQNKTIAMLGPSNLDYIITMLALSRMGYTVFILSPRLSTNAYVELLKSVVCYTICSSPALQAIITKIQREVPLSQLEMLRVEELQHIDPQKCPKLELPIDKIEAHSRVAYIMHSSGSTGSPKPIYQTHKACIENYMLGHGLDTFLTVPLYHTHGHACFFRSIYKRCCTYLLNCNVPVTSKNLVEVAEYVKPAAINAVPYNLKLLAENEEGLRAMKRCKLVSSAGSALADELGNKLVSEGIHVISLWGSTETGAIMNSMRPFEDKDWSYMSVVPSAKPYIWMKPLGESMYELVALEGLASKVISNSDDPPYSFHTRDIFAAHPTKQGRWKHLGRMDDRIVLSNGEKILPLAMEGRLREEAIVREAVVFGVGRSIPGLLLFRSSRSADMDNEAFLDSIFPAVDEANTNAESFAEIMRPMIVPLDAEVEYPQTDKGTIIRAQVYKTFEHEIENAYQKLESSQEGALKLDQAGLECFIWRKLKEQCSVDLHDLYTDFFVAGVDSLQAIKLANVLRTELFLGGNSKKVDQSSIFENSNVKKLAEYLLHLQSAQDLQQQDIHRNLMSELIQRYSSFEQLRLERIEKSGNAAVVLTGATGSLGAHVLYNLLQQQQNFQIYCLVRASSVAHAHDRVFDSLAKQGLKIPVKADQERMICLPSDLSKVDLGLEQTTLRTLQQDLCLIIHNAWSVNFNWSLSSFEEHHIRGTYNLLRLALSSHNSQRARFIFCSSVSVAASASRTDDVPEKLLEDLSLAGETGYAQSKMVAEYIVNNAARSTGTHASVLRIGQIVGSREHGVWNDSELIPLVVRSSLILGSLPRLKESCAWLPVDCVAQTIIDIASETNWNPVEPNTAAHFFNIVNPKRFSWTEDFLPSLRVAGLDFRSVSTEKWLRELQHSDQDPARNPTIKLLPILTKKYGNSFGNKGKQLDEVGRDLVFTTDTAQKLSPSLRMAPNVVESRLVVAFVQQWLKKWTAEDVVKDKLLG